LSVERAWSILLIVEITLTEDLSMWKLLQSRRWKSGDLEGLNNIHYLVSELVVAVPVGVAVEGPGGFVAAGCYCWK
jgi:hypothetical protein